MKKSRYIIGFTIFGFLISFFFGLFSKSGFGTILIKALVFSVIFGLLGFAVSFVFGNFLESDANSSISTEPKSPSSGKSEHKVDIMVQDEELPSDGATQAFNVGSNHSMLNQSDLETETENKDNVSEKEQNAVTSANKEATSSFVPISSGENLSNFSGTEAKSLNEVEKDGSNKKEPSSKTPASVSDDLDELDNLPDLGDIPTSSDILPTQEEQMVEDSDFSKNGASSKDVDSFARGEDSALMAKAISTLLAKDK